MDLEIKKQWTGALRSKNYQQGKGQLRNEGFYCCLGVLCTISNRGEWMDESYHSQEDANSFLLPDDIAKWADLDTDPEIPISILTEEQIERIPDAIDVSDGKIPLSKLNDEGFTFEEIADLIERGL